MGVVRSFLRRLADVDVTSLADGDALVYDSASGKWINSASGGGGGAVDSVFGRTGVVVATNGDYTATQVGADASGAAAAAQAASQPLDSDLTAIAALTTTVFGRALLALADQAALLSAAGAAASTHVHAGEDITSGTVADARIASTIARDSEVTSAVTALSSVYQPLDSDLTAIAALTTTTFGRSLLALADAAAGRTALGLGTLATQSGTFSGTSSGTNTGDQTTVSGNAGTATALETARNIDGQSFNGTANVTVIAPGTHAATGKTSPVDADEVPLVDSAASNVLKKVTWANVKATLKTYFDTLYSGVGATVGGDLTGTLPNPTLATAGPGATGPLGSATVAPIVTIDAKGRVTGLSSATIVPAGASLRTTLTAGSSQSYANPGGSYTMLRVVCIGAGGQGGGGFAGGAGSGGGGGGGGAVSLADLRIADVTFPVTVNVGAGGSAAGTGGIQGGAAAANGTDGGASNFGAYVKAGGGGGGVAGLTAAGTRGGAGGSVINSAVGITGGAPAGAPAISGQGTTSPVAGNTGNLAEWGGASGGSSNNSSTTGLAGGSSIYGGPGGGSGAGGANTGGAGGANQSYVAGGGTSGGSGGASPNPGGSGAATSPSPYCGQAGAGGGGSLTSSVTAGAGGAGGIGAGGGGGGSSVNATSTVGGKGGSGGDGRVIVVAY